jgi:hypothetical protein
MMAEYEITKFFSNEGTRNNVRMRVVEAFSNENAGTGRNDEASRYTYYVETLRNGDRVYLRRPANLHNGFDFLVCVENANYAEDGKHKRNYPKHDDLGADLEQKKAENPERYKQLYALLKSVFECHDINESEYDDLVFETGLPVDHILKTIKWLFIEQDIRYWNYSGRNMTWGLVPKED